MGCRYEKETKIFGQPPICELTGGVCGICNNGDYTFCLKIRELENAIFEIERLVSSSATTRGQLKAFIKAIKKDIIND